MHIVNCHKIMVGLVMLHRFINFIMPILPTRIKQRSLPVFAIIVLQMYCFCKCSVALPHGVVG